MPGHHDRAAFAQALRAVGEPMFGRKAREVSMSRLLAQLFEITALFDMRLRPELVLMQKTMVTVEGVARRMRRREGRGRAGGRRLGPGAGQLGERGGALERREERPRRKSAAGRRIEQALWRRSLSGGRPRRCFDRARGW